MKLMPGSVPAPKNVNPSLQMFTSLMSICWSQVKRDTAEAHDATTTAAMWSGDQKKSKSQRDWRALYLTLTSPEWLFRGVSATAAGTVTASSCEPKFSTVAVNFTEMPKKTLQYKGER